MIIRQTDRPLTRLNRPPYLNVAITTNKWHSLCYKLDRDRAIWRKEKKLFHSYMAFLWKGCVVKTLQIIRHIDLSLFSGQFVESPTCWNYKYRSNSNKLQFLMGSQWEVKTVAISDGLKCLSCKPKCVLQTALVEKEIILIFRAWKSKLIFRSSVALEVCFALCA